DLDAVLRLARSAPPLEDLPAPRAVSPSASARCRIGVARDAAFHFYYPENLEALQAAGADLVFFSPLETPSLPAVDGLYLGGGFPEVFMDALAANAGLRADLRAAIEAGMPVYAECGGLMYLARSLTWGTTTRPMVGALPCDVEMTPRPQGHGYVHLVTTGEHPWLPPEQGVRGHEFHHSRLRDLDHARFAYRVQRGHGINGEADGIRYRNVLAGYTHLHALATPTWAPGFVNAVAGLASLERA
ncbi:MAG: cobyrinic acid a,c-diamide synthase, partial [Anaerolineae bacterium]